MKIVCLSDFHGKKEYLKKFVKGITLEKPDLIFFAGDVVRGLARGEEWLDSKYRGWAPNREKEEIQLEEKEDMDSYRAFYNAFGETQIKMMMVPGNMDAPWTRFFQAFEAEAGPKGNITLVHGAWTSVGNYLIGGFGGEITESQKEDFFVLQFPQKEVREKLKRVRQNPGGKLMLFHTPPYGYLDIDSGRHKGIDAVTTLIEEHRPALAVFGHSHKAKGKAFIGESLLVNPGAMKDGNWAVVELEKKGVKFYNVL